MTNLIPIHKVIAAISIVYTVVLLALLYFKDGSSYSLIAAILYAISGFSIASLALFLFIQYGWRYVWRWLPIAGNAVFPDLNGEWDMRIDYTYKKKNGIKNATAKIKQSLVSISMEVISEDSASETLVVEPLIDPKSRRPSLCYVYRVTPDNSGGKKYDPYDGYAMLSFGIKGDGSLSGNYHTSSQSFGHFSLFPKRKI